MTEPLPDTWHARDLIVLRAAVSTIDETGEMADVSQLCAATGLSQTEVERAVLALDRGQYVTGMITRTFGGAMVDGISEVGREAYRLTGAWPSPDAIADKLLAALTDVAENGDDEVSRSRARKALEGLGGLSRDLLVSVAGAAAGVALQ